MTKYKLIKKYPGLPNGWSIGTTIHVKDNESIVYKGAFTLVTSNDMKNNPEFWQKVEEKEQYQILSFYAKDGYLSDANRLATLQGDGKFTIEKLLARRTGHSSLEDMLASDYWSIHSVKRLSDDKVFTIGDTVESTGSLTRGGIKSFNIGSNGSDLWFNCGDSDKIWFKNARHIKSLFTSADGVEIYEGDNYWFISENKKVDEITGARSSKLHDAIKYRFKSKEKAEEKAKEIKEASEPKYSENDVRKALINGCHSFYISPSAVSRILQLLKSKNS